MNTSDPMLFAHFGHGIDKISTLQNESQSRIIRKYQPHEWKPEQKKLRAAASVMCHRKYRER
jgi:hypothetical protein